MSIKQIKQNRTMSSRPSPKQRRAAVIGSNERMRAAARRVVDQGRVRRGASRPDCYRWGVTAPLPVLISTQEGIAKDLKNLGAFPLDGYVEKLRRLSEEGGAIQLLPLLGSSPHFCKHMRDVYGVHDVRGFLSLITYMVSNQNRKKLWKTKDDGYAHNDLSVVYMSMCSTGVPTRKQLPDAIFDAMHALVSAVTGVLALVHPDLLEDLPEF